MEIDRLAEIESTKEPDDENDETSEGVLKRTINEIKTEISN